MKKAHLTKRWSGRATVPSNFTGVHLILYLIVDNGRISLISSICSQQPQTFWKKRITYLSVAMIIL